MTAPIDTVVIGATGYVGGEFLRLIAGHPGLSLAAAVSSSRAGDDVGALFPALRHNFPDHRFVTVEQACESVPRRGRFAVFSAAPHGASAQNVRLLLDAAAAQDAEVHIVDVSADFRYPNAEAFAAVYGQAHAAPELLDAFVCAVPEHLANTDAAHVGHPGCFATAVLLAAVPLVRHGLAGDDIFVSAVTGSTGSGRSPAAGTHHPERHANLYAYKPLAHRHVPEITALIDAATGSAPAVRFVPHSGPYARGIYVTLQTRLARSAAAGDVAAAMQDDYAASPFVHVEGGIPRLKDVVASNHCHLGIAVEDDCVVVFAAIDNLVKGAAGGAVQWMNRLWSFAEETGLMSPSPGWT